MAIKALVVLSLLFARDVYIPPVTDGAGREAVIRTARQPISLPSPQQKWLRVRTEHFDIISSMPEARVRSIAHELETLMAALLESSPRFRRSPTPTRVFLFERRRDSQPYFDLLLARDNATATGVFVRHSSGGSMIVDGSRSALSSRTAMHELVHDLLSYGGNTPPLWLDEGLAEYFGGASVWKNNLVVGAAVPERVYQIRRGAPLPLQRMLSMRADDPESATPRFYAHCWAAVTWLMTLSREAFFPFMADVENGVAVADALRKHYGRTTTDLEHAIAKAGTDARVALQVRRPAERIDVAKLDRATLLYELGRFLSVVRGAEREADRHYRAALDADPRHALTLAALR